MNQLAPIADPDSALKDLIAASTAVHGQTVFPPDERIPVDDTTAAPFRSVALLGIYDRPGHLSGACSGSMLSYNVVLTAAHCLYDDGFADSVLVIPGATPAGAPYGAAAAARFVVPKGWGDTGDRVYDFGLIFLDGAPFKNYTSPYLTAAAVPDSYLNDPSVAIATAGYPGDKPALSMWFTAGFSYYFDDTFLYTRMDAYPGQSGSPIYSFSEMKKEVFLVGVFSAETPITNIALRFTEAHLTALKKYSADNGATIVTRVIAPAPPAATPTRVATTKPSATPTPSVPRVQLSGGFNLFQGPTDGSLTPADFTHCLPAGSWSALYVWDPQQQRWLHYFANTPAYVNGAGVGGIATIPRLAGVALITNSPVSGAFFPNGPGRLCP